MSLTKRSCGARARAALAVACLLLGGGTRDARAVDGGVDVRASRQEGRAGAQAYETSTVQNEGWASQRIDFARDLYLQLRYGALREATWSRILDLHSDFATVTQFPSSVFSLRRGGFRLGLNGEGFRKDYSGLGFSGRRDDRLTYGGWAQYDRGRLRMHARWLATDSWRDDDTGVDEGETRERMAQTGVRAELPASGDLAYSYTENDHRDVRLDNRNLFRTHSLEYRGGLALGRRGRLAWDAQTRYFTQRLTGPLTGGRNYLIPLSGGYLLDDTPEILDPLEGELIGVSALFDNDRAAATPINIGDDASVVREFGGDYRNIQLDFGAPRQLGLALLYVDRILLLPQFIQWRLFVTDDPEGRDWQELPPEAATVTWREEDSSQRGWVVTFLTPVSGRFFKMVDVKSGSTVADLFVTELEVYDRTQADRSETRDNVWRHRLDAELAYRPLAHVSLRYAVSLDERRYDSQVNNLSGVGHVFSLRWRRDVWTAGGSYESHLLRIVSHQNTDVRIVRLDVGRGQGTPFATALLWSHTDDRSRPDRRLTDNVALQATWEIAPALSWSQKITYGQLDDAATADGSRSWVTTSVVRGSPRRSIGIELRRRDRWVSQAASPGFTRFNETESLVRWSPWPLLGLSSQVRYQVRDEGDNWLLRHLLSWTPLPGGSVEFQASLNDFQDTRADLTQRGAGFAVVWRPRPRLVLEGGMEKSRFTQRDERNWPLSSSARVNWTF